MNPRIWTPDIVRPPEAPVVDGALQRFYREQRRRDRARWGHIHDPRLLPWQAAVSINSNANNSSNVDATTSLTHTTFTVNAGSDRALIVMMGFGNDPGAITTVEWDSAGTPQALTQIGSTQNISAIRYLMMYGLIAPTVGNLTLQVTWTNSVRHNISMIALNGVNQTGGTTSFANWNSASATSVDITSAIGDLVVATHLSSSATITGVGDTVIATINSGAGWCFGSSYQSGASTVTMDWTTTGGTPRSQGVSVVAAGTDLSVGLNALGEPVVGGSTF